MLDQKGNARGRAQIALEFMIVYSFVLVLFVLMFTLVSTQRAASMSQQEYSMLQLQAQNIADYIDQAIGAGSGYAATIPISGSIGAQPFNVSISTTGVVIAQTKVGTQIIRAYAFSNARNIVINGTQTQSGNGITVYKVPIQMGSIYLKNSNGAIYVDMQPASTLGLADSITFTSMGNMKVAQFGGSDNLGTAKYLNVPNFISRYPQTSSNALSFSFWIYLTGFATDSGAHNTYIRFLPDTWTGYDMRYALYPQGATQYSIAITNPNIYTMSYGTAQNIPLNTWEFITTTYTGVNSLVYLNGVPTASYSGMNLQSTTTGGLNAFYPETCCVPPYTAWPTYYGSDLQYYTVALTANQVATLYAEGMGGAPIATSNNVGWWPLNGNTKDYSGNNNDAFPTNVIYQSVAQISSQVRSGSGASTTNTLVGFVTSKGILSPNNNGVLSSNGNSLVLYTNSTGSNTLFLTSNGAKGIANLTINTFNDNITTASNLVGWWPLDEGYGSIAYDMSGHYNNGAFINPSWIPFTNQTNFAIPTFSNGASYIEIPSPKLNIKNGFTITAWVNPSTGAAWCRTVFATQAFRFGVCNIGYPPYYSIYTNFNAIASGISTATGLNPGTSMKVDNYGFVTLTWNGTAINEYANGSLVGSTTTSGTFNSASIADAHIGADGLSLIGGADFMYGQISNLQFYSTPLTNSQITQLYKEGISGLPLGDTGLSGWWPLAYDAKDYSSNKNNGQPISLAFNNIQYTNPNSNSVMKVANFNGVSYVGMSSNTMLFSNPSAVTVSTWIYLSNSFSDNYRNIIGMSSCCSSGGYDMIMEWSSGNPVGFEVVTSGGTRYDENPGIATPTRTWLNYVGVYNGISGTVTLYINGVQKGQLTGVPSGVITGTANPLYISNPVGWASSFPGYISNVQIYNAALTTGQVQQVYQQGMPLYSKMNVSLG